MENKTKDAANYNTALNVIQKLQAKTSNLTNCILDQQSEYYSGSSMALYWITLYCEGLMMVHALLYLVGVPETDSATKWQLPHQQIVHPSESKLQVLHLILLEIIVNVLWRHTQTQMLKLWVSC